MARKTGLLVSLKYPMGLGISFKSGKARQRDSLTSGKIISQHTAFFELMSLDQKSKTKVGN